MGNLLTHPREVDQIAGSENPSRIALMLYGSHARGTATSDSDIDILELVEAAPRSYSLGRANVTQYTPSHLTSLARRGSLFVRHLSFEGLVLSDPTGRLRSALALYQPPASYDNLRRQIEVAGGVLDPRATDISEHASGLARLGIYLLRTSIYVSRATQGSSSFDLTADLDADLQTLLELRRRTEFGPEHVSDLYEGLRSQNPGILQNQLETVEAYAVAHSTRHDSASLFAPVLGATGTIDYGTLTLPPF